VSETKKSVVWAPEAREQLRAVDRRLALEILSAIDDYLTSRTGEVKKLRPPRDELRLRVGELPGFLLPNLHRCR
jgi:hypothetical protein